ncbi:MAG TPA: peroxiredoxin, partial [Casimicrobiaceae bacterium]
LDRHQVERAARLSKEKYCSATAMLAKTAEITYDVEVLEGAVVPGISPEAAG